MAFRRILAAILVAFLVSGLAAAYVAAAVGLTGYINARTVSLIAITGASIAFVAAVAYFASCELRLRRSRHFG
jgi:hypothetical protein